VLIDSVAVVGKVVDIVTVVAIVVVAAPPAARQ
jgi:hypothetical protein